MKFLKFPWFLFLVAIISCSLVSGRPLQLAPSVDLSRIMGGWYIVAAIPNGFEKRLIGMFDYYSLLPDGSIREDFFTHRDSFAMKQEHFTVHDTITPGSHNALWHVHFFGPISAPFPLLYVSPDDNHLLFGEPNRELGWIYSHSPLIDEKSYRELLRHFEEQGYDSSRFLRIVQFSDQLDKPGFTSPPK